MDHAKSQQAREFLRSYVNGNRKLITDWLDGSGNAEDIGSHLLCIMLERLAIDEKPDLSGIAGGHVIKLFQTVPGGSLALGRLMAQRLEAGLQIPPELVPLCAKLLRQQPMSDVAGKVGNKRGPKARNGRRDALRTLARIDILTMLADGTCRSPIWRGPIISQPSVRKEAASRIFTVRLT